MNIMATRTYSVGVPLVIEVDDTGRVTFEVDLSEVDDFVENIDDLNDSPDLAEDVDRVDALAEHLGYRYRFGA